MTKMVLELTLFISNSWPRGANVINILLVEATGIAESASKAAVTASCYFTAVNCLVKYL